MKNQNAPTEKEIEAMSIIIEALSVSKNPMMFNSFGKDSLVLLTLIQRSLAFKNRNEKLDCVFLMDGLPPYKYAHAFNTAAKLNINIFSYPPTASDYFQTDKCFEVIHYFYVNGVFWYVLTTGCYPHNTAKDYSCAVLDLLTIPTVDTYDFRWDCIFHGHKQTDDIHVVGEYKMNSPTTRISDNLIFSAPLYNWTDEEVWAYVKKFGLHVQKDRYKGNIGGRYTGNAKKDRCNPDAVPTCFRCLDVNTVGKTIICPRTGKETEHRGKSKEENKALTDTMAQLLSPIGIQAQ